MLLGFSTGAFYKFTSPISIEAVNFCKKIGCNAIELGCGRVERLKLLKKIKVSDLKGFKYISMHGPDIKYSNNRETKLILNNIEKISNKFNLECVVIHPDSVKDWNIFNNYSFTVAVENMDETKISFQTANTLLPIFSNNNFKMALDLNHCFVNDNTMKIAEEFINKFREKICEIHLSGNSKNLNHDLLYKTKQLEIINKIFDLKIPIIIESVCSNFEDAKNEYNYIKKNI